MRDYQNLEVWKLSHTLLMKVYLATRRYPSDERFVLTAQTKKSALSIGSNIAEGAGRTSPGDFRRFIDFAYGSANELEYQLFVGFELGFLAQPDYHELTNQVRRVQRMLAGLRRSLR